MKRREWKKNKNRYFNRFWIAEYGMWNVEFPSPFPSPLGGEGKGEGAF
jgi:hypothetical protein